MALINLKKNKYQWQFENIGGTSRVQITSGEDIAHLSELDLKMWTVLSCPVTGLEIEDKSLAYIDCDSDGKIRVNDILATAKWIVDAVKDPDLILEGKDSIDINNFNRETESGRNLYNSAKEILTNLSKDSNVVSLAETKDIAAIFAKTKFNGDGVVTEDSTSDIELKTTISDIVKVLGGVKDRSGVMGVNADLVENFYSSIEAYMAWQSAAVAAPYGDKSDAVYSAYKALDAKIKDFFMRSKLAAFSPDSISKLDVQVSQIENISASNLIDKESEIASYPIARITGKCEIDLTAAVNPAWAAHFEVIRTNAIAPEVTILTEDMWNEIGAKFVSYIAWRDSKAGAAVEPLGLELMKNIHQSARKGDLIKLINQDLALKEEAENIENVDKFLHIFRDFYRLLRNFITFHDLYDKNPKTKAIFQGGDLIIDQRACHFCMNVVDMAKHNTFAPATGMFLVYCDCTTKSKPGKIQIVAAVTVGEVGDLVVGKNAIYYDNNGVEWDAVITKIIDNPISIGQAFWSPYRRIATVVENFINKSAADKDAKVMKDLTDKISTAPANLAEPAAAAPAPFDIAKVAGICAALGMALGMIGTAVSSIFEGLVKLGWWQLVGLFIVIILIISGPAMIMAWLKLRRRNIAPLLNANGWAINASSKISIPFGETLTDIAKYPKLKLKDPYARKGIPAWKKWMISICSLLVILAGLWVANLFAWVGLPSPLPCFNKVEDVVEEVTPVVETPAESTDSTEVAAQ